VLSTTAMGLLCGDGIRRRGSGGRRGAADDVPVVPAWGTIQVGVYT